MSYEPGRDLDGLLSFLKKHDPGGVKEQEDRGGMLRGKPFKDLRKKHSTKVNEALKKVASLSKY